MATLTITRGTTLPDSSGKADFHALIDNATATLTNVVNADIDAAAAIADSKLAQITTASKVSGAAITGLASLPSGAGVIPVANLTSVQATAWDKKEVIFLIDGAGSAITTGIKGDIRIPFTGTITGNYLLADQSGSIVIDLWLDDQGAFPPTVADTITASAKPTLSSATNSSDTTLTGWTTAVTAGDILRVNVDSAATLTRVSLALTFTRTA